MPNWNRVQIIGHLTRDVETKNLPGGTTVAEFGIASSFKWTTKDGEKREDTTFVDCACFGKGGEVLAQYTGKGKPLFVEGRLKYDSWESKDGSGKRSKLSIIVENFQFLHGREDGGGGAQRPAQSRPQQANRPVARTAQRPSAEPPFGDEEVFDMDSLPF